MILGSIQTETNALMLVSMALFLRLGFVQGLMLITTTIMVSTSTTLTILTSKAFSNLLTLLKQSEEILNPSKTPSIFVLKTYITQQPAKMLTLTTTQSEEFS